VADEREPSRRPLAVKLTWWNRAILDLLGLAAFGAGAAAVFITHLEAGPVALIAAGLLLLLIGIGGHMPSRLKIGDNEAQWEIEREAVQVFVERVAEEAPAERQPELIDALGELAEAAPQVASAGLSAFIYERQLREEINRALEEIQSTMPDGESIRFITQVPTDRQGVDAIIEAPTGRRIAIEAKFSSKNLSPAWFDVMEQKIIDLMRAWGGPGVMLLITRDQLTKAAEQRLKNYQLIHHVTFAGPQDRGALIDALLDVMS
jgi:hypothetical protein